MKTLNDLLKSKGAEVWTIQANEPVVDGIRKMAQQDVGSLVVTDGGKPVGIFTERHYAREVFLKGRQSPTTLIRDVMSSDVIYGSPDQEIDECIALMIDKRIRHLPVLDDGELAGLVSIGDLIRARIVEQEFMIEQLRDYIHGPVG